MKKNYFLLAAATMMLAACAETDLVNEVQESAPVAIGFDAFPEKATRAEIASVSDLQNEGFRIWGYKAATASPMDWSDQYTVFDNIAVTYQSSIWKSATTKYWDRTCTYNFYAAAPSSQSVDYSINSATGMITIQNAASVKSTLSADYLIARNGAKGIDGAYTGTTHTDVALNFNHIMSKVSFKLISGIDESITVTGLTMSGWDSGTGKFVQTLTTTPSQNTHAEWSITTSVPGSVTLVGTGATNSSLVLNNLSYTDVTDTYIMVPQTISAGSLTFTIDFSIDGEEFKAQVGTLATAQIWGTDTHTTYNIIVGPDDIGFNPTVSGWSYNPDTETEIE